MGRPKAVQTSFWGTLGKALLSKTAIVIVALVAQAALLIWLVIDLSQYAAYVYAGFLVLSALVILYVVNRDDNPDFKLVWMVPIAALPVVGAVIYLFVRLQLGTRLIRRRIDASEAAAAEVRPRDESAVAAVCALSGGAAVTGYLEKRGFPAYINTDCTYCRLGDEMFPDMLRWSVVLAYVQPLPEPLRNQLPEEDHEGVAAVDDHTAAGMPQYVHDACRDLFRAHQHRVAAATAVPITAQIVADETARNRLFQMEESAFGVVRSSL